MACITGSEGAWQDSELANDAQITDKRVWSGLQREESLSYESLGMAYENMQGRYTKVPLLRLLSFAE